MSNFKIGEIVIVVPLEAAQPFWNSLAGQEVTIVGYGWLFDYEVSLPFPHPNGRPGAAWTAFCNADAIRKRPQPPESKTDQEARERFLKGINERPSFNDLMSDLNRPTEETIKRTLANMERYSGL
jgi:hypothetical protein